MNIRSQDDPDFKLEAKLWLPDADEDGFAAEGEEPELAITEASGYVTACITLRQLCRDCIASNPNSETASVLAGWLRIIANDIEGKTGQSS